MSNKSPNDEGSESIGLPKSWPNHGESLEEYRKRIYLLHQEKIRLKKNLNSQVNSYEIGYWLEIFGAEVDANWKLNKGKKPKTISKAGEQKKTTDPWYFSSGFITFLFLTVLLSPAVPVLCWLRGPRTAKRMGVVFSKTVLTIVIFVGVSFLGSWIEKNKADENENSKENSMPSVVGMNYGEFVDNNSEFNQKYFPDTIDLIESRSVWDNYNWTVVSQIPAAGSKVSLEDRPCLGIVKTDELELPRQKLRCWREVNGFEDFSGFDFKMLSKDLISIILTDSALEGYFLKAKVRIDMEDWNSVWLTYCSYEPKGVNGSSSTNLKLDAGASGTAFGDGGVSFDAGLFLEWNGAYTYKVEKVEKSYGSGCFSF